jgi:O-antigen/teichoic acid export membrane protein
MLTGFVISRRVAVLIDQGLVSGANFLVFLYCARLLSPEQWGEFGFAYATVLFCQGFQRAMVTIPMIAFSPSARDWKVTASAWASINSRLMVITTVIGAVAVVLANLIGVTWLASSAHVATLLTIPMFGMEFARRAVIQEENFGKLVGMAAGYTLGVGCVVAGWPTAWDIQWIPVLAVMAGALFSMLAFGFGNWNMLFGRYSPTLSLVEHKRFSFWATLSHLGFSGYNFGVQSLLGALAGPAALGVFHACRTLLQPVSILIGAMDSIDKPRAARAYAETGRAGLFKKLKNAFIALACLAGSYIVFVLITNTWLLNLAYGQRYHGQESVVALWCLVSAFTAIAQPVESGLYVIHRTRELFYSRLMASALSLACGFLLIGKLGAIGALTAMAVGYAVSAILGLWILKRFS